ncbi:MAG: type II toxin-antitoxin system Phd/YefM family antitoxin [Synergistaceae bacterium]|jgi:PHD/YefM family antitoxin component YafN of YafNO toxin-antitoxin module|nr:type II toxin-antitoxin system Phd/YefM family antitoxin [Synergistaceae bacterium]
MPIIKSSTDLRNSYNEISAFCHENLEPVFITKNGQGDLAVMSIETYERLNGGFELYGLLAKGRAEIKAGRGVALDEAMQNLKTELSNDAL